MLQSYEHHLPYALIHVIQFENSRLIELDREMQERNFQAKLLLQVHDELIFEVPEEEVESLQSLVEEVMENAVSLSVPLKADSNIGNNWYEAK